MLKPYIQVAENGEEIPSNFFVEKTCYNTKTIDRILQICSIPKKI